MFAMTRRIPLLLLALCICALCICAATAQSPAHSIDLAHSHLVDLTYTFDENTIYWPTADGFKWKKDAWGPSAGGYFYASASYGASEHGGTHLDSPLHFAEGHPGTDQIPITDLIAPTMVIDIAAACDHNPDYLLSAKDCLELLEENFGRPESRSRAKASAHHGHEAEVEEGGE